MTRSDLWCPNGCGKSIWSTFDFVDKHNKLYKCCRCGLLTTKREVDCFWTV